MQPGLDFQDDSKQSVQNWLFPAIAIALALVVVASLVTAWLLRPQATTIAGNSGTIWVAQKEPIDAATEITSLLAELAAAEEYEFLTGEPVSQADLDQVESNFSTEPLVEELDFSQAVALPRGDKRWQKNASTLPVIADTPKIALVIDDLGLTTALDKILDKLPAGITYSFLTYGEQSVAQATAAKAKGHEILVHLPMEAKQRENGYSPNPGPGALMTAMTPTEIAMTTTQNIKPLLELAVGANNHMGSAFTADAAAMRAVLTTLAEQELIFLDSLTTNETAVRTAGEGIAVPLLQRDVFIDHYRDEARVLEYLNRLVRLAQQNGQAIGIGHPYPETFAALDKWLPTLAEQGVQLVPLTQLIDQDDVN